jgi:AcrR family transcriptional regulator
MTAMVASISTERGARARIYKAAVRLFGERGGDEIAVSELADAAGIARGTVYNNVGSPDHLFADVASSLSREMLGRAEATMRGVADPAERLATGMRLFIRRAHEDQDWGRFMVRFTLSHSALQTMMRDPPARDIRRAIDLGRFSLSEVVAPSLSVMLTGSTLATMNAVILGDQTWRTGGSDAAMLFLRAGGVAAQEAEQLANLELPPLAAAPAAKRGKEKKQ